MQIIDILSNGAGMLGLTAEQLLLESANEETETEVLNNVNIKELFNLVKFSIQELCSNYIPVANTEEIEVTNLTYELNNFTNYVRIQNVYLNDCPVKYKILNRALNFQENGTYKVVYETYPNIRSMFDRVDFLSHLSPDVLVFGLCAYYCLSKGMFEDFKEFHGQYLDKAESLKDMKTFNLPARRWE